MKRDYDKNGLPCLGTLGYEVPSHLRLTTITQKQAFFFLTGLFYFTFLRGKFSDFRFFLAFRGFFFNSGKILEKKSSRIAVKSRIVAEHRAGIPFESCAPCHHPSLHRIGQDHTVGHSQTVAGRRKHRAQRELYSSSRQSQPTDIADSPT